MAAVLESLLFASPAAHADDVLLGKVNCLLAKGAITVSQNACVDVGIVVAKMNRLGTVDFNRKQLIKVCEVDLYGLEPGEDASVYHHACERIYDLTF
ncbi:hypothetical protein [Bradyrhizobium sp. CCGUVB14]|uniref:hypothetical protein n=1 Tax=Bradyrhizobium sp. CCGUVB14 TaxID=2949628 RepID=UPI0020B1C18B|nr:hypothetical protein [Bradyrhizobium sp. CCGUVB14]MCP3444580.1 hypothetical protein [Bradyrhizobium sp. CCGUVB14]